MKTSITIILSLFASVNLHAGLMFQTVHPAAVAWRSNCVSVQASSANYPAHFYAVNALTLDLAQRGIFQKMVYANPCAGDALAAAQMTLKHPNGSGIYKSGTAITNFNFVSGDYSVSAGITGNGTSKYFNTGVNPRSHLASTNSMSIWGDVFTAATAATSSSILAGTDAAQEFAIGWYISGTVEAARLANPATTDQYTIGSSNALASGFFGANVYSQEANLATNAVATRTSQPSFQGVCWDPDSSSWFVNSTTAIYKSQEDGTWLSTNSSVFSGGGFTIQGGTVIQGGFYYSNNIYLAAKASSSTSETLFYSSNSCIARYDTATMTLNQVWFTTNEMPDMTAIGVNIPDGLIYACCYYYPSNIWIYSLADGSFLSKHELRPPVRKMQGLCFTNGLLLATSSISDTENRQTVYAINTNTWESEPIFSWPFSQTETGDIEIYQTNVVVATMGTANKLHFMPYTKAATAARRGVRYWNNNQVAGNPRVTTGAMPNTQLFLHASNNNGTPGSYTARRLGCSFVGDGLTSVEIGDLYLSVLRFDRALGRR